MDPRACLLFGLALLADALLRGAGGLPLLHMRGLAHLSLSRAAWLSDEHAWLLGSLCSRMQQLAIEDAPVRKLHLRRQLQACSLLHACVHMHSALVLTSRLLLASLSAAE